MDRQQIRDRQRQSWNEFSGGWEKWDSLVLRWLQPVADEMLRMLAVSADAYHLDVASGTGEPGLTIATIASRGRVVLTDLAAGMLDAARRSAARRGLTNVQIRECSADALPFPDESFDSVSCRMGFMFFPDLSGALYELRRVLRPGGRLCASVWAEPDGNAWATISMDAIATETDLTAPPSAAPGLFSCSAPGALSAPFESVGLHDVREADVHADLYVESAREYWHFMTDVAAPVVAALAELGDDARRRIEVLVVDKVRELEVDGRLSIPAHARCVVATR